MPIHRAIPTSVGQASRDAEDIAPCLRDNIMDKTEVI